MREIARLVPSKSEADIIPKNASNHMASHGIERKKPLRQTLLKSKRRGVIREIEGSLTNPNAIIFDDAELLGEHLDKSTVTISKIQIYVKKERIKFVSAVYRVETPSATQQQPNAEQANNSKQVIELTTNLPIVDSQILQKLELRELLLPEGDPLRFIYGYFSDQIDYLKFESETGKNVTAGRLHSSGSQFEFKIEVKKGHTPQVLFGALDYRGEKKSTKPEDLCLVALGLESKLPFDPLRLPYYHPPNNSVEENINISEEEEDAEANEKRKAKISLQRKIRYKLKKNKAKDGGAFGLDSIANSIADEGKQEVADEQEYDAEALENSEERDRPQPSEKTESVARQMDSSNAKQSKTKTKK